MFGQIPYSIIGGLIGYILCPLSLLALIGPFAGFFPDSIATLLGWSLLVVAALVVLCNLYLTCRRCVVVSSASFFPLVGAVAGAGGLAALYGPIWWIPAMIVLGIVDLIGQPLLSAVVIGVMCIEDSTG